ncbi:signal recognition particle, SRP19 subunit [Biscogniauxia mediterranea]|nr:signal recognition particle, SRP19 subunit [Biscogniauxia mediterranea]
MSHARIEEVSDSDMSDPSEGDIDDFDETEILRSTRRSPPAPPTTSSSSLAAPPLMPHHPAPAPSQQQQQHVKPEDIKDYQMLYPVYFDARRTRSGGRRVSSSLAVPNPLARTIASACAALRLSPVLEAHRTHPRDWANPGRVRVRLGPSSTTSSSSPIKNKHHLYVLVARYLREHPTTEDSDALRRGVREFGLGVGLGDNGDDEKEEGKKWPRPAVPRGWEKKMGDLLPAYSAAMTGGGVSENAFKEMMKEMQGAGAGGGPGGGGGMPGLPGGITPEMMNMFGGMGGMGGGGGGGGAGGLGALASLMGGMGGGGGSDAGGGSGSGGGGGGKKGKKGKGKA